MAAYLVTGGAGFIGSHIVDRLVELRQTVRVLDNFCTGRIENIEHSLDKIELIKGSIVDMDTVRKAVEGMDFVLHQAAIPSVPRSVDDPLGSNEANITGTLNVLIAARDSGVKRVVYASSSSVYGDTPSLPKVEDMPPDPLSPYALTKLAGEYYCKMFTKLYGLETVVLRYFNVFGPRQDPNSQYAAVIPKFLILMAEGRRPTIYGDGLQSRDFTYVENNVTANLLACERPDVAGEVLNIACGESFSLLDLVDHLNRILGKSVKPMLSAPRPGDVKHSSADIQKARRLLGFSPEVDFYDGLQKLAIRFRGGGARATRNHV
ncbi:MAG TPA: SDR family oxidoreductase [Armatimonadota bacterium]|nr:SDR family oxidoreductase [Armatimonadota bacterium]